MIDRVYLIITDYPESPAFPASMTIDGDAFRSLEAAKKRAAEIRKFVPEQCKVTIADYRLRG